MITTFIDAGAHTGESIPKVKKKYGEDTEIWCYEPVPCMANYIYDQWKDDPKVHVVCAAVWDTRGYTTLRQNDNSSSATVNHLKDMPGNNWSLTVKTVDIVDVLKAVTPGRIVMTLDVEGVECDILEAIEAIDVDELYVEWHSRVINDSALPKREMALIYKFRKVYRGEWLVKLHHIDMNHKAVPYEEIVPGGNTSIRP